MTEVSNVLVVGLGMGTVFVGLICLILICYIMGAMVKLFTKGEEKATPAATPAPAATAAETMANKGEFAAAVAAAIAEDLGTDVTGIRINSVKKL